jgi:ABC-type sugar transport system substrate-binding protein
MKKTLIWIMVAVFAISFSIVGAGCKQGAVEAIEEAVEEAIEEVEEAVEEVEEAVEEEMVDTTFDGKPWSEVKVGYVMPYLEGWFFYWDVGFKVPFAVNNIYTETILTNWDPEAELQGIRDFITKGFDAISLQTASPDVAQTAAQICNEAGIPLFIDNTDVAEGPGKAIADIEMDWVEIGRLFGRGLRDNAYGAKVVEMQGAPGFPVVTKQEDGMEEILAEDPDAFTRVQIEYNQDYSTEVTFNALSAIIQSGTEFDAVIGGYQESTEASIEALKANDISLDDIYIISGNGGPLDEANFEDGDLDAAVSEPVGFHAMLVAASILEYLTTGSVLELQVSPAVWVTKDDWKEKLIPWEVDASWLPVAEEFVRTGVLNY